MISGGVSMIMFRLMRPAWSTAAAAGERRYNRYPASPDRVVSRRRRASCKKPLTIIPSEREREREEERMLFRFRSRQV